jgi:nitrous oxide reductase
MAMRPDLVEALLWKLCVDLGICLHSPESDQLCDDPPEDVAAFVDAVFTAEGMDPTTADRHLYRQVRDYVTDAFRRAQIESETTRGQ